MRLLSVFNQISLDGYFTDENGDISWAHRDDPEWSTYTSENASGRSELLFGRVTYEMMAAFWPTPMAAEVAPVVARTMNEVPKIVVSRTLESVDWQNSRLLRGDLVEEVGALKAEPGDDLLIMGSGSIIPPLLSAGLIDRIQIVIVPVVLGRGRSMFEGVAPHLPMTLTEERRFSNGNVVLSYEPAEAVGDDATGPANSEAASAR